MNLYVLPCLHFLVKPKAAHLTVVKKTCRKLASENISETCITMNLLETPKSQEIIASVYF